MKRLSNILFLAFLLQTMLCYTQNSIIKDSLIINKSKLSLVSIAQLTVIGTSGVGLHFYGIQTTPLLNFIFLTTLETGITWIKLVIYIQVINFQKFPIPCLNGVE